MTDTYRELYFDKSDQLLKLMEKSSWLLLELKMYKELYEETNQLLIETRAKLVEITKAIETRPTTREPDKRDSAASQAFPTPDTLSELEGLS